MIYFLQPTDGGPIKIGHSDDVEGRRQQLEYYYGQGLALLATMDGGRDEERAIHAQFAHLRLGQTEQFRPALDLLAFIGRPLFVNQGDVQMMQKTLYVGRVFVRLDLSPETHRKLRVVAAEEGKSMAVYARDIVEQAVQKRYAELRK